MIRHSNRHKALRAALVPRTMINVVSETRVSRGAFIRATTAHSVVKTGLRKFGDPWLQMYKGVLADCPRKTIQLAKRNKPWAVSV